MAPIANVIFQPNPNILQTLGFSLSSISMFEFQFVPNKVPVRHPSKYNNVAPVRDQFLVPQIEYPQGSSSKNGSHVYILFIIAMVLLL